MTMTIALENLIFEISAARFYFDSAHEYPEGVTVTYDSMYEANERAARYLLSIQGIGEMSEDDLAYQVAVGYVGKEPIDDWDRYCWSHDMAEVMADDLNATIARRLIETKALVGI